jgi:hypothetical protein
MIFKLAIHIIVIGLGVAAYISILAQDGEPCL